MATTALTIIKKAMQKAGIIVKNETPDNDEMNDGLDILNDMISSWSNDSMLLPARVQEAFPLVASQAVYTMGPGKTFNTDRPIFIADAYLLEVGSNSSTPINVEPQEVYNMIQDKGSTGLPRLMTSDNGMPFVTLSLWPVPISGSYTLNLLSEKQLTQFALLNQTVVLPPGWNRALIYNLAIDLCSEFGEKASDELVAVAKMSKASIQRAILKNRTMDAQQAMGYGGQNIYTGWFR